MKIIKNNKGASMLATMIAAGIGLVVVLGISKSLMDMADQTTKLKRKGDLSLIKQNLSAKLRDPNMWLETLSRARASVGACNNSAPGRRNSCPIVLYQRNEASPWMCRKRGGTFRQGVVIVDRNGQPQNLNCSRCRSDDNCGFDKKSFSRVVFDNIRYDPTSTNMDARPSFEQGALEDTAGTKGKDDIEVKNSNSDIYDETQVTCPAGQFLIRVQDGQPVCRDYDEGIKGKGCAFPGSNLVGFDNNGNPICRPTRDMAPVIRPTLNALNGTCPARHYLAGYNNRGNPVCRNILTDVAQVAGTCPAGYYFEGFNSNGTKRCKRINSLMSTTYCPTGQLARGVDAYGRPICVRITSSMVRTSTYSDSCDKCDKTKNIGTHFYCSLSDFGSGGWNSDCSVWPSGNRWYFKIHDADKNDQTTRCKAVCIDFK